MAFLCTYTASFSNDKIFPQSVRTTAIGQCQFIGRMLTVFASEAIELPKPQPILCFCMLTIVAIVTSLTFDKDDVKQEEKKETKGE